MAASGFVGRVIARSQEAVSNSLPSEPESTDESRQSLRSAGSSGHGLKEVMVLVLPSIANVEEHPVPQAVDFEDRFFYTSMLHLCLWSTEQT